MKMITNSLVIQELTSKKSQKKQLTVEILKDYWICRVSRETSLMGRREVLTGKAKFGILGDGKEVPQVAMARAFKKGDWRSGYYRDQTFMFALGLSSVEDFFAQLYADTENDPFSGGRQMNAHFASPMVDKEGNWINQLEIHNISSDISSTGGQMARGLGLAFASRKYRTIDSLRNNTIFSKNGNEVCFCTIGDASTSEGIFWESINAAAVMQVPMAISVWDDGYGISVPKKFQTVKQSISEALQGFKRTPKEAGIEIFNVKGYDYIALRKTYEKAIALSRKEHVPVLIHVEDLTQPQGHSTSGSHERYKSKERLEWEKEHDCILKMRNWMLEKGYADEEMLDQIDAEAKTYVRTAKNNAWKKYSDPVEDQRRELVSIIGQIDKNEESEKVIKELNNLINPSLSEIYQMGRRFSYASGAGTDPGREALKTCLSEISQLGQKRYYTNLYSHSKYSALNIPIIAPTYAEDAPELNGYQIINKYFDFVLDKYPNVVAFGEDVGKIGDVNQGFAGLQEKYGIERVFDTGIREWSIMGQAIGLAMRGFRPIVEIQYLDYLIYGLQPLCDDLATLRYRSNGLQQAPAVIRTRGHRLEGIWHAGSPMAMLLNSLKGMYIAVPRNMVQAAGIYNTLLQGDDPGLVVECLNGYRLKEALPENIGEFTVPLGVPEILEEGTDVTLVTYGSCIRVAIDAVNMLEKHGISVELIDIQTLIPFDLEGHVLKSLKKTNRLVILDEDVPGGASAYLLTEILEKQNGYRYLDSAPLTITAGAHRTPFGSDGDYFTKPNPEKVFENIYSLMKETHPTNYPLSFNKKI